MVRGASDGLLCFNCDRIHPACPWSSLSTCPVCSFPAREPLRMLKPLAPIGESIGNGFPSSRSCGCVGRSRLCWISSFGQKVPNYPKIQRPMHLARALGQNGLSKKLVTMSWRRRLVYPRRITVHRKAQPLFVSVRNGIPR